MSGTGPTFSSPLFNIANSALNQLCGQQPQEMHMNAVGYANAATSYLNAWQTPWRSADTKPLAEHHQRIKRMCDWLEAELMREE